MFETSMFVAGRRMSRQTMLVLLPLSILFHAAVIVAAISVATWTVDLPAQPPPQMQAYQLVTPVPTPPPPPPPPRSATHPEPRVVPEPPRPDLAPPVVPDKTPVLPKTPDHGSSASGPGDPNGVDGGVDGGQYNGVVGGVGGAAQPAPPQLHPIVVTAEVQAPKVLHRVEPVYPELARRMRLQGYVVVRCVIDKTGALRNIEVLSSPSSLLSDAATAAVRQWKFSPGMLRGNPVDVYFTLTVMFNLRR